MVSASGSLLSEVTQGAATVWRNLLLNLPGQCIHVMVRAATITCMVGGGMQLYGVGVGYMRRTGSNGE